MDIKISLRSRRPYLFLDLMTKTRRSLAVTLLVVATLMMMVPQSMAAPIEWRLDPETGHAVAQLTTWDPASAATTQDNYALYYHQHNHSSDGRFLVYQSQDCYSGSVSPSSLTYRLLDLETGVEVDLLATGLANGAVVHGDHLYVVTRDDVSDPYDRIEKVDFETQTATCLTKLPAGHFFTGALTVNVDGSQIIYQTVTDPLNSGGATWVHRPDPSVIDPCQYSNNDFLLRAYDPKIEHIQFSPTDREVFTFIDQGAQKLSRIGIGRVGGSGASWNNLSSAESYFDLFHSLPHPFWGADGSLWSDIIGPSWTTDWEEAFVKLDVNASTGWVQSFTFSEMAAEDWHHHQAGNRALDWFVGDGLNISERPDAGVPFISLFHVDPAEDPGGTLERHELADSLGAENSGGGNAGTNAHLLSTLDGALWTAPYDFSSGESSDTAGCAASRNVFLVKIPPHLKARLDDTIIGGSANGPFKHASRVVVDNELWALDYGRARQGLTPPTLGDGSLDHTAGAMSSGADSYALADLDGDDVADRLAFTQITGGWRIEVAYSPYDGVLPSSPVAASDSRDFASIAAHPPVFGDLNGDGRDDMVRIEDRGQTLMWQGRFSVDAGLPAEPYVPFGLGWEFSGLFGDATLDEHFFVADVNGDGYGDRILVRPWLTGWQWLVDFSTSTNFGDGVADSSFIGASSSIDHPLVADVDGDGKADIVIARQQSQGLRWFVNKSTGGGFGPSWTPPVGVGYFGAASGQPLIGSFSRFYTAEPLPADP